MINSNQGIQIRQDEDSQNLFQTKNVNNQRLMYIVESL